MTEMYQNILKKAEPIFAKYGVLRAGVFGSVARGEARENSDIDMLVAFQKPISLIDFIQMKEEMMLALGRSVDLVSENALISHFRPYVYQDLQPIYEKR